MMEDGDDGDDGDENRYGGRDTDKAKVTLDRIVRESPRRAGLYR
jgi:hypothetical protein